MKKIGWILLFFVTYLLQSSVIPFFFGGVSQPNLFLLFIPLLSLHISMRAGVMGALIWGLLHDIVIGNFFGLHVFSYVFIAVFFGIIGKDLVLYREQWGFSLLAVLGGTLLSFFITYIMLYIAKEPIHFWSYAFRLVGLTFVYHGILTLPAHKIIWDLKEEETYRW